MYVFSKQRQSSDVRKADKTIWVKYENKQIYMAKVHNV